MAASNRPWDVRLWLYPGGNPGGDAALWGLEEDISSYLKFPGSVGGQSITYRSGRRGNSGQASGAVDASEMDLSLENTDGRFCPDKIDGPYWPLLDLNTPIRMGVVTGYDSFTRTTSPGLGTSTSGDAWTGSAGWTTNGSRAIASVSVANTIVIQRLTDADAANYDFTVTGAVTNASTGASQALGGVQYEAASNYLMFRVDFGATAGAMSARIHRIGGSGSSVLVTSDPLSFTYTAGELFRIRCQREGVQVRLKVWKAASAEPAAWTCTASEDSIAPGQLGIFGWKLTGNTNAPALFEFDDFQSIGLEFTGYVTEWPTDWDMTGGLSWAAIKAAGILRRLRQARTGILMSPLRRQLPTYSPTGYWPLEDGARANSFASAIGGQSAKFNRMTLAADDSLPGTLTAATFNATDGSITAFNPGSVNGANGFAVSFLAKPGANPPSKTRLLSVTTSRGTAARIDCAISHNGTNAITYVDAFNSDGVSILSTSGSISSYTDWTTDWFGFCLKAYLSGGNTVVEFIKFRVGDLVGFFSSDSFATGLTPIARNITVGGTGVDFTGTSVAHLVCALETLPFISYPFFNAASGFESENVDERLERLGLEAGIPIMIEPGTTVDLGPQARVRPVENMQSAVDAELGILYEWGNGLGFRPRAARRNQPVLFSLSKAAGHIADVPKPVRDDQRVRNKIVVTRDNASSATSIDQASIDRVGEYEEPVSLPLYDDSTLQDHADLRRFLGTRKGMRWPGVRIDFARNPSLLPAWRRRQFGFRFTVTTGLSQVRGSEPDLLAEGYSASLDPLSYTVDLECADASVWDTGVYDDPVANRSKYGPTGATLNAGINTAALSIAVLTVAGETWKTGAVSYSISIDGEHIPITSVSGPVANVYTLTASARAGNAVSKSHLAGAAVTLANQVRYGF